jgi:hypothetical protein
LRVDWTEGRIEFDFSAALQTCQPDAEAAPLATIAPPLKSVDFYVWYERELWLIEIKDPEAALLNKVDSARKSVWSELKNDALLKEHLLPKLFGAFVHLSLENVGLGGRIRYGILIALTDLSNADRNMLTDKVERVVQKIGPKLRGSRFWPQTEVHNISSWNKSHATMSVTKRS